MKTLKSTIITLTFLLTTSTFAIDLDQGVESEFFNSNSKLYYEIGGARRISPPISNNRTSLQLGLGGNANIGYSCGEFDYGASFKNLMNGFKNGVDDVKNALTTGVSSAVSSLPLATLQRAMPGVYDMFQEFSFDANNQIDIATKSCEQMEAELAQGENPYADFIQIGKAQSWKNKAASGDDIVQAKKDIEKDSTKDGIRSYSGEYVGGHKQPPLQIVASTVGAGFNRVLGSKDANANITPDADSELYKHFKSKEEAITFATDVLGEYEINNEKPITKVGLGLYPKVRDERERIQQAIEIGDLSVLDLKQDTINRLFSQHYYAAERLAIIEALTQQVALQTTIKKSLIVRRMLITGEQDPNADNKLTNEQRSKVIAKLDADIDALMFEYRINNELKNLTAIKINQDFQIYNKTQTSPNDSMGNGIRSIN